MVAGCVIEKFERLKREGLPISRGLSEVHACVGKALAEEALSSQPRTNSLGVPSLSTAEGLIGVAQAAEILSVSPRYVQKIAADLDGAKVDRKWLFKRTAIEEYAEERSERCG